MVKMISLTQQSLAVLEVLQDFPKNNRDIECTKCWQQYGKR